MEISQHAYPYVPQVTPESTLRDADQDVFNTQSELRNNHCETDKSQDVRDVIIDWRLLCDDETALSDVETGTFRRDRTSIDSQSGSSFRSSTESSAEANDVFSI